MQVMETREELEEATGDEARLAKLRLHNQQQLDAVVVARSARVKELHRKLGSTQNLLRRVAQGFLLPVCGSIHRNGREALCMSMSAASSAKICGTS